MKKLFTLLTMLLLGIVSSWADTQSYTVTYEIASSGTNVNYSKYYQNNTVAMGNWCNRWEVRGNMNLTTFNDNIPGASFTSNENAMNISGWDSKLRNTSDQNTFSIHAIGTGIVTSYTMTAVVVDSRSDKTEPFTKTITPAAGGDAVTWTSADNTSKTISATGLTANSATFTLSGTNNGEVRVQPSNFQMTIQLTLLNSNSDIDENKYYYLACPRGGLSTNDGQLASTFKNGSYTMKPFAFVKSGNNYYLYSLEDNKYVSETGALADSPTAAIEINTTGKASDKYPTYVKIGTKYLRTSNYQTTYGANTGNLGNGDAGNYYAIIEGGTIKQYFKDRIESYHGIGGISTSGIDAASGFADICSAYRTAIETVEGKYFLMKNYNNSDKYLYVNSSNVVATTDLTYALVQFRFMNDGTIAIYGITNEKYVGVVSQSTQASSVDTPIEYIIEYNETKGYAFRYKDGNGYAYLHCDNYNKVVGWSTNADHTWWTLEGNSITYILKENDVEFLRSIRGTTIGTTITALPSDLQKVFTSYSYPVSSLTTVAGKNEFVANVTFEMPFTSSVDYASARWYYMTMRTTKYAVYGESAPYTLTTTQDLTSNGMWAFIGNPYTGIKVINKAAGEGKYLQATANQPSMTTTPTYWTIGNQNGNFTLSESSKGYIHDTGNNGNMVYWNNSDAATDDGSVFRVEEAEPTIVINKTTGTYYLSNGTAISNPDGTDQYWGPTWKSTRTVGGNILLTLTTASGMNSRNSNIYTGGNGAAQRYTLTAGTGYVITGYSVTGTANSTDITITPRVRKNITIETGNSGTLSVADLDLKTTSFTLSGANSTKGNLSGVILSVTLKPTATVSYTAPVTNNTTAAIGYKHIATATRNMTYMTKDAAGVVSPNQVGTTFDEAPSTVAEFTFEYDSNIRAYYIKETSTNKYVYAKDDLTWEDGNRNTTTNVAALGVENLPDDDEGKTLFQWLIYDGGNSVNQPSYYIRPKCNTNTAVSVQSMSAGKLGFYDNASKNYEFAHASLLTWKQLTTLYYNTTRDNNVRKAGKIGYPKTTSPEYTTLLGLLSTFTDGHTYTKSDYTNLLSRYDSYIAATDIVTPPANTFWRINSVLDANASLQAADAGSRMKFSTTKDAETIFFYDGSHLLSYSKGVAVKNVREVGTVGQEGDVITFKKALNGAWGKFSVSATFKNNENYLYSTGANGSNADRNTYSDSWRSNNSFTLEEIPSLPVTFKAAGLGYATFNCPVPVKIPSGVSAYVSKINGTKIKLYQIHHDNLKDGEYYVIPANTPVLLHVDGGLDPAGDDYEASFVISDYDGEGISGDDFYGTIAAEAMGSGTYYSLRAWTASGDTYPSKVGFYTKSGNLAGFKAWIHDDSSSARNFTIVFDGDEDPTGIVEALGLENDNVEIYDLNGRKLSSYKKGINIVNGKKVMIQ